MTTFAALGDSITLGLGDPTPAGGWRGWAVFLAEGLPAGQLHNLATTGAKATDLERTQLPRALELRPDVASVVVGINDTLRQGFDPARIQAALSHVIGSLSAAGAVALTMRLPDPGRMLGMPAALARPLGQRIHMLNEVMDQLAAQFGTLHFDAAEDSQVYERCMWSVDRLHPSERGHRHIACCFHDQLAAQGHPVGARPGPRADQPAADPPRPGHVDGDQGHRLGAAPLHGPAALPAGDGGPGLLPPGAARSRRWWTRRRPPPGRGRPADTIGAAATLLQAAAGTMATEPGHPGPGGGDDGNHTRDREVPVRDRERGDPRLRRVERGRNAGRHGAQLAAARHRPGRDPARVHPLVRRPRPL